MNQELSPPVSFRYAAAAAYASVALVFLQAPWVFVGFIIAWAIEGGEVRPAQRSHPVLLVSVLTAPLILAVILAAFSLTSRTPGRHRGIAAVGLICGVFGILIIGSFWLHF